jgi:DNA-binding NarL/FixJ family response regulator
MGRRDVTARRRALPAPPEDLRVVYDDDTLVMSFALRTRQGHPQLTAAELDVMADLLAGYSNRDIAHRRGRSTRTIANQVASILSKLGVRSRLELVALAPLSR